MQYSGVLYASLCIPVSLHYLTHTYFPLWFYFCWSPSLPTVTPPSLSLSFSLSITKSLASVFIWDGNVVPHPRTWSPTYLNCHSSYLRPLHHHLLPPRFICCPLFFSHLFSPCFHPLCMSASAQSHCSSRKIKGVLFDGHKRTRRLANYVSEHTTR